MQILLHRIAELRGADLRVRQLCKKQVHLTFRPHQVLTVRLITDPTIKANPR